MRKEERPDGYLHANRRRWDQLANAHLNAPFYDLEGFKAGKERLRSIELTEVGNVNGKTLLHLQCHFGLDTLAWARRGAIATGVDFSPDAVSIGQSLAEELAINARFVCAEISRLTDVLTGKFDIVFTSYGVLHGLPDLATWGQIIAYYLKPGGKFYMVEDHPMFRVFRSGPNDEIRVERSYFLKEEPQCIVDTGSYALGEEGQENVYYVWDHSLSEIITSLLAAGLELDFFHEFPFAARAKFPGMVQGEDGWWRLPGELHGRIPFLFSLQARKPEITRGSG